MGHYQNSASPRSGGSTPGYWWKTICENGDIMEKTGCDYNADLRKIEGAPFHCLQAVLFEEKDPDGYSDWAMHRMNTTRKAAFTSALGGGFGSLYLTDLYDAELFTYVSLLCRPRA